MQSYYIRMMLLQIALLESKKSYVRYISHELRTPLNTAFLGLKLLTCEMKASTNPKDVERYDTLCDVNISCMAAVDILNDLLCYEKLDSGILVLHKEDVIVVPFINECISMFSVQARECGVAMIFSPGVLVDDVDTAHNDDALISHPLMTHDTIFIDKFKMDQVIRNLISNALKFTPRGGIVTVDASFVENNLTTVHRITNGVDGRESLSQSQSHSSPTGRVNKSEKIRRVSTTQNVNESWAESDPRSIDGKLVLVVTDTGAGISMENQKRLFKDIVQFNPEKLQAGGGSGLGLWISGGIVDLHDGKISVYSEGEGMGSSFTVEIPMMRMMSPLPSPSRLSQDNSDDLFLRNNTVNLDVNVDVDVDVTLSTDPGPTPTHVLEVLVVDDSRLNRKMLLKVLKKDGHICTEAEDGLEAIERVKERIDFANGSHGKPYDAILMDFVMPNMDGPTAVKCIRSIGYKAPIFGVTGNGEFDDNIIIILTTLES